MLPAAVVYPLASLSGCTQAIAEVPDNIQAIRTTSGGACNDTGFLLIDYQLRHQFGVTI